MNLNRAALTLASLFLFPLSAMAGLQCPSNLTHVNVSGNVTTLNVSATRQVGQICMTMIRTSNGKEVFKNCGAIVGTTLSANGLTGESVLTHTAVFDKYDQFFTHNDRAQITGIVNSENGVPCAYSVVESVSVISSGGGLFRDSLIQATAVGTVSFCASQNLNTFALLGEACVKN